MGLYLFGGLERNMTGLWLSRNIGKFMIQTDELIFFRGVETTNQLDVVQSE